MFNVDGLRPETSSCNSCAGTSGRAAYGAVYDTDGGERVKTRAGSYNLPRYNLATKFIVINVMIISHVTFIAQRSVLSNCFICYR